MAQEAEGNGGKQPIRELFSKPKGIRIGNEHLDVRPNRAKEGLTLTRRNFLRLAILLGAGIAAVACGKVTISATVKLARGEIKLPTPMELQARYLEGKPPPPEEFLKTEDYPIVGDTLEKVWKERQEGNIANTSENPFGHLDELDLFVYGDLHQSGSDPRKSALFRSVYNILLRIGKNQVEAFKRYARLKFTKGEKRKEIKGEEAEEQEEGKVTIHERKTFAIDNWALNVRARRLTEGWLALRMILYHNLEDISKKIRQAEREPGVRHDALGVINLGDNCGTESDIADVSSTGDEIIDLGNRLRDRLKQFSGRLIKVVQVVLPGNHDEDLNNHPFSGDFLRKLYGSQSFLQYVGNEYVILGLNTNLYDTFFIRFKEELEGDPRFMIYLLYVKQQEEEQRCLIEEAIASGRKIIVFGHGGGEIMKAIDVTKARVTHVIHGHTHTPGIKNLNQRNSYGEVIGEAIVGATLQGIPGWEKVCYPVSYSIHIGLQGVEIKQLGLPKELRNITPEDLEYYM